MAIRELPFQLYTRNVQKSNLERKPLPSRVVTKHSSIMTKSRTGITTKVLCKDTTQQAALCQPCRVDQQPRTRPFSGRMAGETDPSTSLGRSPILSEGYAVASKLHIKEYVYMYPFPHV